MDRSDGHLREVCSKNNENFHFLNQILKYSPLEIMHLCQRFFRSPKHFSNSIFEIAFSSFSDTFLMSSMAVKRRSFKVFFSFENRKKSYGTMSGEYEGWGIVTVLFFVKN